MSDSQKVLSYYQRTRFEIIDFLSDDSFQKILEIGCGSGNTLAQLKKQGITKECYGLEINEYAVENKNDMVDEIKIGDISKDDVLGKEKYDAILFIDVLEHLLWPYDILKKISSNLTPDGKVIICIPNLRHGSILKKLIFHGLFDYSSCGLMDSTHIRFFTIKSFLKEINNLKIFTVERINSIYKKKKYYIRDFILQLFNQNDIITYQYLIELKIKK